MLASASAPGVAQGEHQAGIVIRFDDSTFAYVLVPFSEDEISGIDLLSRSPVPLVTVEFGGLGQAVCTLDGQGAEFRTVAKTSARIQAEIPLIGATSST